MKPCDPSSIPHNPKSNLCLLRRPYLAFAQIVHGRSPANHPNFDTIPYGPFSEHYFVHLKPWIRNP